jgi:hypothetical protein
MSIATLKRKTAQTNKVVSSGRSQFSINGGYRNQGYIGQNNLFRSFPMTLMKGNVAKGNGGLCGAYNERHNIVSGIYSENDPSVIKKSVVSNRGKICNKSYLKSSESEQSSYITKLKDKTVADITLLNIRANNLSGIMNVTEVEKLPVNRVCNMIKIFGVASQGEYLKSNTTKLINKTLACVNN